MSTQNFPNNHVPAGLNRGADNVAKHFTVFLILSIVVHAAMVLSFLAFSPVYKKLAARLSPMEPETMTVDVVELPPAHPATGEPQKALRPPKTPTRYAQRANVVEKETFPEAKKTGIYRPGIIIPPLEWAEPPQGVQPLQKQKQKIDKARVPEGTDEGAKASSPQNASTASTNGEGISKGAGQTDEETVRIGKETVTKESSGNGESAQSRPNLFLPEETISALAKKYEAQSPQGEQGKTLNLNTSELRYANYLINMKRRIELYWEYPEVASRSGWHGRLFINFTIKKDGTLGDITLAKSSGYPVLDDAAITALKLAAPFSAFPENFGIEQINIKGQFEYAISYSHPR